MVRAVLMETTCFSKRPTCDTDMHSRLQLTPKRGVRFSPPSWSITEMHARIYHLQPTVVALVPPDTHQELVGHHHLPNMQFIIYSLVTLTKYIHELIN